MIYRLLPPPSGKVLTHRTLWLHLGGDYTEQPDTGESSSAS